MLRRPRGLSWKLTSVGFGLLIATSCGGSTNKESGPSANSAGRATATVTEHDGGAPQDVEAPADHGAAGSGGDGGAGGAYEIDPKSLVGCRAPDEPGCLMCCVPRQDGGCSINTGEDDWSQYPNTEPWYNRSGDEPACPADCAACATCSESDERRLRALPLRDCDCEDLEPVEDACFAEESCECYCEQAGWLFEACPPAP